MALIKCPECNKEISDKSTVCINCGCPVTVEEIVKEEIKQVINEQKNKKRNIIPFIIMGMVIFVIAIIFIIVSNLGIEVPSLYGVSEDTAISILTSNSLIPNVVYEYDDNVEKGLVIRTNPWAGDKVDENSVIEVVVSNGPSFIQSKDSNIRWWYVDYYKEDDWNFTNPYIKDGYLYIECTATFGTSFNWKENGYGTASINDTFDKSVPIKLEVSNNEVTPGVEQTVNFIIPLNDLDVQKPTTDRKSVV